MSEAIVAHILDDIPFQLALPQLMKRAHVKEGSPNAVELAHLAEQGAALARPKALYLVAYITNRGEDFIEIEGFRFQSTVLRVNLDQAFRVFPYLATCGQELQSWAEKFDDMLLRFWAESIKEMALAIALVELNRHIDQFYFPGDTSSMSPGSLPDWPIQQQRILFDLFGTYKDQVSVTLTDSMLMIPTKSVSGVRFPTTSNFESCQLCPRENCPGRRAPYDAGLFESQYHIKNPSENSG